MPLLQARSYRRNETQVTELADVDSAEMRKLPDPQDIKTLEMRMRKSMVHLCHTCLTPLWPSDQAPKEATEQTEICCSIQGHNRKRRNEAKKQTVYDGWSALAMCRA